MSNANKYVVHITNKNDGRKGYWANFRREEAVPRHEAGILTLDNAQSVKDQFVRGFSHWTPVIEKVETETIKEVKVQEFKVGNKVKLVKGRPAWHDNDVGKTGVIDRVWDYSPPYVAKYGITFDDGRTGPALSSDYFELLEVKKKPLNFMRSNNKTLTIVANSKSYTVAEDHPNYKKISEAIVNGDASELDDLVNPVKAVVKFASVLGVEVKDGVLHKDGEPLRGVIADKILSLHKDGLPIEPLVKFYDNLMANPSKRAVEELYPFLDHKGLPITSDGHFLAYKRVTKDFKDLHTRTLDNSVGKTVEMPRNAVCDDPTKGCHTGLHAGALEYVRSFSPGNPVVIVKINPADVICIPYEDHKKLRCSKYVVVQQYDENLDSYMEDRLHDEYGMPIPVDMPDYDSDDYWGIYDEDEDEDDSDLDDEDDDYAGPSGFSNEDYSRSY